MAVSGQSIRRKEDIRFITGKGRYTDDVCLPDQCHAIFARSPIAHANITSIDTTVAPIRQSTVSTPVWTSRARHVP